MRLLRALPLLFLFSCGDQPKDKITPINAQSDLIADSSKQRLMKIIEGGWVNEEYINELKVHKSPMYAALKGLPVQQLAFDISKLNGDTLINMRGRLNYHEGERFDVVFYRKEDSAIAMKIDENRNYLAGELSLNYEIKDQDTVLLLTIAGEKTVTQRFHRVFRSFPEEDNIPVTALDYFVNGELLTGVWSYEQKTITFDSAGRVRGFNGYTRYSITTIDDHPASQPDEITFYNDTGGVSFAFDMRPMIFNSIDKSGYYFYLYQIHESADGMEISRGNKLFTFSKVIRLKEK